MSWLDRFEEIRSRDWSQAPAPDREEMAREVVQMTAYASAAASVVPVPLVDLALLLPFHTTMVMTVGHVFGRNLTDAEAKRVAVELGAIAGVTLAGRAAISVLKKLVLPGIGGLLAAPASFAVTWAFGRLTIAYFKDPDQSREVLNSIFKDAMKEGTKHFSKEAFDRFRRGEQSDPSSNNDEGSASAGSGESPAGGSTPPSGASGASTAASGPGADASGASSAPGAGASGAASGASGPAKPAGQDADAPGAVPADPTLKTKKRSL